MFSASPAKYSPLMRNNGSVRMFEVLGRRRSRIMKDSDIRTSSSSSSDIRTQLMEDYSKPELLPGDVFQLSGVDTDYQWAILR